MPDSALSLSDQRLMLAAALIDAVAILRREPGIAVADVVNRARSALKECGIDWPEFK